MKHNTNLKKKSRTFSMGRSGLESRRLPRPSYGWVRDFSLWNLYNARVFRFLRIFLILFSFIGLVAQAKETPLQPPKVAQKPKVTKIHGYELSDPYFWLREKESKEVIKYLEDENAYVDAVMKPEKDMRENLFKEMVARIKEDDSTVPAKYRDYLYYSRTEKDKQYKIYVRKRDEADAKEEVLADGNKLADGKAYFSLAGFEVSPNQKFLAYSVDFTGGEVYSMTIKDLETGEFLSDKIEDMAEELAWGNDNKTIFYTRMDSAHRSYRVFRHVLGTATDTDELLYQEDDQKFSVSIEKTRNEKYLIVSSDSNTSSEIRILEADNPGGKFTLFAPRKKDRELAIDHHDDRFFILSNEDAQNFRIMEAPTSDFKRENWKDFIPHDIKVKVDGIDLFKDFAVIMERREGFRTMRIYDFRSKKFADVPFPEPVYNYWADENMKWDTNLFRFQYTSLVTPRSVYDLNLDSGKWELKKLYEVLGGHDPKDYTSERIYAVASDGVKIPISIVFKNGVKKDGKSPMYLTGYGSYGSTFDPYFSSIRLSLLQRGFIYAIAHVRGGGEMGRPWYADGKLFTKKNTFTDFVTCTEHLINEGYSSTERLAINGGSAGGLLIGAAVTMRPDLYGVAVADVPFVDVINTMLDSTIPLTVGEYEEWGDPNDKKYFDYMLSYSPYDNIKAQVYPNMLVTAGLNDPRVQYWEPAKFVAKLRAMKTDFNTLLLKTNMGAGHGGASGRYDYLKEIALEYAFILKMFKIPL